MNKTKYTFLETITDVLPTLKPSNILKTRKINHSKFFENLSEKKNNLRESYGFEEI